MLGIIKYSNSNINIIFKTTLKFFKLMYAQCHSKFLECERHAIKLQSRAQSANYSCLQRRLLVTMHRAPRRLFSAGCESTCALSRKVERKEIGEVLRAYRPCIKCREDTLNENARANCDPCGEPLARISRARWYLNTFARVADR